MSSPAQITPPVLQSNSAQPQLGVKSVFHPVSAKKNKLSLGDYLASIRKAKNIVSAEALSQTATNDSLPPQPSQLEQEKLDLDLFEQVLDEMDQEKVAATAQPILDSQSQPAQSSPPQPSLPSPPATATATTTSPLQKPNVDLPPLNQSPAAPSRKEVEVGSQAAVEQAASIQVVEAEKFPELSPEVEKYLQEVHDDKDQAPKEIAIADEIANLPTQNQFVSEPVIVVPITPEIEKKGKRKSPKFSIRWLVEWSQKIIKMFAGKVVYMEAPSEK